ncbi:MAG TPA: 4'-phosphopantetheinyl transferase superfamily protein [Actinomycetes bacterium]|nr:4'-phosphopantetheinyl transferase superfamily protein [Actinomycetes bacterium]
MLAAPTAAVLEALPGAAERLTAAERRRMAGLRRAGDRADYLAAHALARACAARFAGAAAGPLTLLQRCPRCGGGDHGRPSLRELPGLRLSLSHTSGYVAAMAGWGPVGVDAERSGRALPDDGLAALALSRAERALLDGAADRDGAFLRLWVRKEALVKLGELSLDALAAADLSGLPMVPARTASHRWRGLHLLDWSHAAAGVRVQGAAAAAGPVRLEPWPEGGA